VILSAHISGSVIDYDDRAAALFAEIVQRYRRSGASNHVQLARGY